MFYIVITGKGKGRVRGGSSDLRQATAILDKVAYNSSNARIVFGGSDGSVPNR